MAGNSYELFTLPWYGLPRTFELDGVYALTQCRPSTDKNRKSCKMRREIDAFPMVQHSVFDNKKICGT